MSKPRDENSVTVEKTSTEGENSPVRKATATHQTRTRHVSDQEILAHLPPAPIFVLVAPQMGENIGAAARAMLNFGVRGLRLVAPRDGWPNPAAKAMAAGASTVIDGARVFETLAEALDDCHFVLATTARSRELRLPVFTPQDAATLIKNKLTAPDQDPLSTTLSPAPPQQCAILFGGERSGLTSKDIALCDGIITVPVNPAFASLNLAQAVLIMAYEWGRINEMDRFDSPLDQEPAASRGDFDRMLSHLEEELEAAGFFYPPEKKPLMMRNLSAAFMRAGLTHIEMQTMRGVIKALAHGRGKSRERK